MTPIPELYAQGVPLKEIARLHNTSISTASKIATAAGLSRSKGVTTSELAEVSRYSDLTAREAARALGMPFRRVNHIRDYYLNAPQG